MQGLHLRGHPGTGQGASSYASPSYIKPDANTNRTALILIPKTSRGDSSQRAGEPLLVRMWNGGCTYIHNDLMLVAEVHKLLLPQHGMLKANRRGHQQ